MALVNIPRDVTDAFYRYKMPALVAKVEGRGNGIKTVIVNMADIAKSLDRPASYTTKFFGFELGALTTIDPEKDRYIVNGKHDQSTLAKALDNFIERFVLCKKCGRNPETKMLLRSDTIILHCIACGNRSPVDMRHRLATYILKNPSDISGTDDGASKKDSKKKTKKGKKGSSSEEEEVAEEKPKATRSKKKEEDEDEEDVVWYTDTSKEAAETRRRQMLDETSELAAKLLLAEKNDEKGDPIENLHKFAKTNPTNEKLAAEIRRVQAEERWNEEQVAQVVFYMLFDVDVIKQLKLSPKVALLKEFVPNDKAQLGVLAGIVMLTAKDENLRKSVPHILKGLYDEDILEEEVLITWHDKRSKGDTSKVKEASTVFVTWLKNADEEESDGEEDEEEEDSD